MRTKTYLRSKHANMGAEGLKNIWMGPGRREGNDDVLVYEPEEETNEHNVQAKDGKN